MVNIKRGPCRHLLEQPKHKLHTVGMDIGYGDGKSPGGFTHCLVIIDLATRHAWTYGLANVGQLFKANGIKIGASLLHRQSQSGTVEIL
jgi:hypothetical protein